MSQSSSHGVAQEQILYDIPQAAARLHVSESWLKKAVTAKRVPHRRWGRVVRFSDSDIADIIAAATVAPANAPNELRPSRRT